MNKIKESYLNRTMNKNEALKQLKKKKGDLITFNFWMGNDIIENDIIKFHKDKILWNAGKIEMTKDEINRLRAFQYACFVKGLKPKVEKIEKDLISSLKKNHLIY